jgi:Tol biopolymer transport system component
MNADGTGKTQVTHDLCFFNIYGLSWSPDGRKLALGGEKIISSSIYTVGSDGTGLRLLAGADVCNLSSEHNDNMYPAWSPDGEKIAFVSLASDDFGMHVVNPNGSSDRNLGFGVYPSWSPDGKRILFADFPDKDPNLFHDEG